MDSKYNVRLLKAVFGEPYALLDEEGLANDEELNSIILELLEKNFNSLPFIAMHEYFLEGKSEEELSAFIRENSDAIARETISSALRILRKPENARRLLPFFDEYEKKENEN